MKWQLPAGAALLLLLLLLLVPTVNEVAFSLETMAEAQDGTSVPPPPPETPPPPPPPPILIPTETNITQAPTQVRKGEPFEVRGYVRTRDGHAPVAGVTVEVFLNVTKEAEGLKVGEVETGPDGTFLARLDLDGILPHDYQLVAGSQVLAINETHGYEPSWSDPPVRIISGTSMVLQAPAQVALGATVPLNGTLTDDLGEPVRGAEVMVTLADGTVATALTDAYGVFEVNASFPQAGTFPIEARFPGTAHLAASAAVAEVEVVDLALRLPSRVEVVRGEQLALEGEVAAGGAPLAGATVQVGYQYLAINHDGHDGDGAELVHPHLSTATSDEQGRFAFRHRVALSSPPGEWTASAAIAPGMVATPVQVAVYARTNLTLQHEPEMGRTASANVTLLDDRGAPLFDKPVRLTVKRGEDVAADLEARTDAQGHAAFALDLTSAVGHTVALQAAFAGEGFYLPASAPSTAEVRLELPPEVFVAAAALAAATVLWLRHRRRLAGAGPPGAALAFEFPDIEAGLPWVWEPGVPLAVRVTARGPDGAPLAGAPLEVRFGDLVVAEDADPGGAVELEATLPGLGEHRFTAALPPRLGLPGASARAEVRAVDYRAEVGREYDSFRDHLRSLGFAVSRDTAPLELESVLARRAPPPADLDPMLRLLEVASWSWRPFVRADYVKFMRHQAAVREALAPKPPPASRSPYAQGAGHAAA